MLLIVLCNIVIVMKLVFFFVVMVWMFKVFLLFSVRIDCGSRCVDLLFDVMMILVV